MSETAKTRTKTKRPRGLKRPKTTPPFQLPPTTPSPGTNSHTISSLSKQTHLLTLLLRRNKNQHRSQPFFQHLHILRRALTRLLDIHTTLASTTSPGASTPVTAESVRRRFEAEASLRAQRDVWEGHIREVVVPRCYVAFGALVADTQFANLGVVLIGVLADVFALVGGPRVRDDDVCETEGLEVEVDGRRGEAVVIEGTSTKATGEDWGEVVERVYEATDSEGGLGNGGQNGGGGGGGVEAEAESSRVDYVSDRHGQTDSSKSASSKHAGIETGVDLEGKGGTRSRMESIPGKGHDEDNNRPRKKKKKGKSAIDDLFKDLI